MLRTSPFKTSLLGVAVWSALAVSSALTQPRADTRITSPAQAFGTAIGNDYFLATYSQLEAYWKTLDRESDRMRLVDIGRTEEGRTQWMAVVSAPENLSRLDHYKQISRRLSLAEVASDDEARTLAREGKAVVWIDGGLHASEVLGAQQLIEQVYQLVSQSDAETLRVLRDVIVLAVHANPDGHELVSTWYMREPVRERRSLDGVPRAYQKYVGHDNNRDFFLSSQAETINMNRILYREWFPQIVYNHHQSGPAGTVMFAPPFREPFNYVLDPLVPLGIDLVAAAMHSRFAAEGKAGVTMRAGGDYSAWWNGGLRTTAYFHNQIGLLTETIGSPTPTEIPFVAARQLPSADLPFPIAPQPWRFHRSVEYSLTANRAVLDVASRHREEFLLNIYRMARNSIERGSRDTWTVLPSRVAPASRDGRGGRTGAVAMVRDARSRDPRGYILPSDQPDFPTATRFVDALLKAGVIVHRATAAFEVSGRRYPAGSFVVKTAQAFRPHVLDMFEPQDHPDDFPYPGAAPTPPYDVAGWTLAFQMGVKFDRILDGFDGPFQTVTSVSLPVSRITGAANPEGYLISHQQNDAFAAVNRLLAARQSVHWLRDRAVGGQPNGTGSMYVEGTPAARSILEKVAAERGVTVTGVARRPPGPTLRLRPVRIGLWDKYGGSSPSGWTRWLLERYEFPFELVFAQTLDAGDLAKRFDVLIFTDEAVPTSPGRRDGDAPAHVPAEYRQQTGAMTWSTTVPQLKRFVEAGGTVIAVGKATGMADELGVPVASALVEKRPDGSTRALGSDQYYVPGSILRTSVDNTTPLGYGFEREVDVTFDNSPVFALTDALPSTRRVAWFGSASPLRSGWAWGQRYLEGGLAVVDAQVGAGRVLLFGPDITFRGQPHGTFKFLFNGIFYARAETSNGL
jgi:hypothetical protein